jgi:hypothetical protein
MAESFTKADVERVVADALKLQSAKHDEAIQELRRAAAKTEAQKAAESALAEDTAKRVALREKALEYQGAKPTLKYIVGPAKAYNNGQILEPGQIATKKNVSHPGSPPSPLTAEYNEKLAAFNRALPSIDWSPLNPGAPKVVAAPEKDGPRTAAEMNKIDAERGKTGVHAPKKGSRPSDTEV